MILPKITERLSRLLKLDRSALLNDEVRSIEPRSLSGIEQGWIQSMLAASDEWETADISQTRVVAEGPNSEGVLLVLQAPAPEIRVADRAVFERFESRVSSIWVYVCGVGRSLGLMHSSVID